MNKNDLGKAEKSRNTIEITIPFNGVISGDNKSSISSDESDISDDDTSKKGQMIINISEK